MKTTAPACEAANPAFVEKWNRPGDFLSRYIQSVLISKAQAGPSGSQGGQKKIRK